MSTEAEVILEKNKILIKQFASFLRGLSVNEKTIESHLDIVDLFINKFLIYEFEKPLTPPEGVDQCDFFLSNYLLTHHHLVGNLITKTYRALKFLFRYFKANEYITEEQYEAFEAKFKEKEDLWNDSCKKLIATKKAERALLKSQNTK